MSSIGTSISINDQMTARLDAISEATSRATMRFETFEAATSDGFGAVTSRLDQMIGQMQVVIEQQQAHTEAMRQTKSESEGLLSTIKKLAGGIGIGMAVRETISLSDELTQTQARLGMMTGSAEETSELFAKITDAAQRSRGSISDMADVVARFGNNAREAFSSNDEVVAFAEAVQKQMTIAGASTVEASNAMLQLSQALGSGVLRGDELNSIFEQAPNLIRTIADYMGVSVGEIRNLASEGQITADIVKNAILGSAEQIDETFNKMPMTFAQTWQSLKNNIVTTLQPALTGLNTMLNLMLENIDVIAPIAIGFAAITAIVYTYTHAAQIAAAATKVWTAATKVLSAVMSLNPVGIILIGVIALVAAVAALANAFSGAGHTAQSAFGVIGGAIYWVGALFENIGGSIAKFFDNMAASVLDTIANIGDALSKLPFIEFDTSGLRARADEYAQKASERSAFNSGWATEAYASGAAWGDGLSNSLFGGSDVASTLDMIAVNTGDVADALGTATEDLKYMRDIAERDAINRFTTAEVKVDMGGISNTVNSNTDLDGMISYLAASVASSLDTVREGAAMA